MFERSVIRQLRAWKSRYGHKPLVLRGARQVGKTTVVKQFGQEFDAFIYLNLERESDARIFGQTDDVKEVMRYVSVMKNVVIPSDGQTLLFIDEIQNEPKAVALLRYFYEEMPELYVIAAGSRLQALVKQRISFPVGRVEYLSLRPCSFMEYLNATGDGQFAEMVGKVNVPLILHKELMRDLTAMRWLAVCLRLWRTTRNIRTYSCWHRYTVLCSTATMKTWRNMQRMCSK